MKKLLLLGIALLFAAGGRAQELKVLSFELKAMDMTAKIDPVLDLNDEPCALIRVAVAAQQVAFSGNIVNAPVQRNGEWLVYVPAGTRRIKISPTGCLPLTYEFGVPIEQNRTYELRLQMPDLSRDKIRSIVLPTFSIGKSQTSYGIMVGFVKKAGMYVRFKSDFNKLSTDFDCDESGLVEGEEIMPWYTGVSKKSRWAATIGYVQRLWKPFYLYAGAGYGKRTLAWETVDGTWARVSSASYKGVEAEVGAIVRFGAFAVGAGVQTNSFKYMDVNLSVGVMF